MRNDIDIKGYRNKDGKFSIPWLFIKNGEVTDLYDFYTLDGYQGATIQFAWRSPPVNNEGRIFRINVKFGERFANFHFP